jgi:hypothetical protein
MKKLYRLSDGSSLLSPARYLTEMRTTLKRIEEILDAAEGFREVDARERLRLLAENTDNVWAELVRTAATKVRPS